MHGRKNLLTWLNPRLDDGVAEEAGRLLDAVVAYLDSTGHTGLFDIAPPLGFEPDAAAAYRPSPVRLPEAEEDGRSAESVEEVEWASPASLADMVVTGRISRAEVVERFATRIDEWQPTLNAFIRVTLSREASDGDAGRLAGVPIGIQDMIDVAGVPTTAGSRILGDYVPRADSTAWRLLAEQGATLAGKLNTHEFAAGTTGDNQWFGAVRNPWDPSRTAGGAAGGPGAAVAAGLVSAAIATDPGGSIRVPAAHNGVVGLKPTFGAMDRTGTIPLTWTTETMGVLARTVGAAAEIADILLDGRARARYGLSCRAAASGGRAAARMGLRIGVPTAWLAMGLDPEVDAGYHMALDALAALGADLVEVELPDAASIAPAHRTIAFSEASSIHEQILATRAAQYGDIIRARQEAGRGVMASEYLKAFGLRGRFARQFSQAWRSVDVIALPTSPVPAAEVGTAEISTGPRGPEPAHTVYTRYSAPMNTLGLPALSVPCGFTARGLPIGLQLSGPPHSEPMLFSLAAAYEDATAWHLRHPTLADERNGERV